MLYEAPRAVDAVKDGLRGARSGLGSRMRHLGRSGSLQRRLCASSRSTSEQEHSVKSAGKRSTKNLRGLSRALQVNRREKSSGALLKSRKPPSEVSCELAGIQSQGTMGGETSEMRPPRKSVTFSVPTSKAEGAVLGLPPLPSQV